MILSLSVIKPITLGTAEDQSKLTVIDPSTIRVISPIFTTATVEPTETIVVDGGDNDVLPGPTPEPEPEPEPPPVQGGIFTATSDGLVPASGGGDVNFLRSDAAWVACAVLSGPTNNWTNLNRFGAAPTWAGDFLQVNSSLLGAGMDNYSATGAGACVGMNRSSSDGWLCAFYRAASGAGSITVTGVTTAYNTTSDGRQKEDHRLVDSSSFFDRIEVFDFQWKGIGTRGIGCVAQDVHSFFPMAVAVGGPVVMGCDPITGEERIEDRPWGIDYSKFVPHLLNEVKALRERVRVLEAIK